MLGEAKKGMDSFEPLNENNNKKKCRVRTRMLNCMKSVGMFRMLEMLEPRLEDEFYSKNDQPKQTNITNERKKIKRLISKEKRGAVKELRKDTSFLAKLAGEGYSGCRKAYCRCEERCCRSVQRSCRRV